jgi:hypothetical protein
MKEWGEANEEQNRKIAETYPDVRSITSECQTREITLK